MKISADVVARVKRDAERKFAFRLASHLRMPVGLMLASMSSPEFTEWQAYDRLGGITVRRRKKPRPEGIGGGACTCGDRTEFYSTEEAERWEATHAECAS